MSTLADVKYFNQIRKKLHKDKKLKKLLQPKIVFNKRKSSDPLESLARIILYQQLSTKAAQSIEAKFNKLFKGKVTARKIQKTSIEKMRGAGLSRSKAQYIKNVAEEILSKRVPGLEKLILWEDQAIQQALVNIKGVGSWTAQMYLLFYLGRTDIWPTTDFGIRKAAQLYFKLKALPSPKHLEKISHGWKPHRSMVALYLWRYLDQA